MLNRDEAFGKLTKILCQIESKDEMVLFLSCILTRGETEDLIDRIRIFHELIFGDHSQRQSASKLGVSISKITRGAANLHNESIKAYLRKKLST